MLRTKIHIVISAIGALLGLSAFVCFCIVFANIEAGMWALMSGKLFSSIFSLAGKISENYYYVEMLLLFKSTYDLREKFKHRLLYFTRFGRELD